MITLPHKTFRSAYAQARQRLPALDAGQLHVHWFRCAALLAATVLQVTAAIQTAVDESRAPPGAASALGRRDAVHPVNCVHRSTINASSSTAHTCDGGVL
jgi:hypothetical protein